MNLNSLFLILSSLVVSVNSHAHEKVLMNSINSLSFRQGQMTSGRRSSPVPQMSCVEGPCAYSPGSMMCTKVGYNENGDPNWKCEGNMQNGYSLTYTNVGCEGYDHPDDPYILKGSCGVEYGVKQIPVQHVPQQPAYHALQQPTYHAPQQPTYHAPQQTIVEETITTHSTPYYHDVWVSDFFFFLFIAIVIVIFLAAIADCSNRVVHTTTPVVHASRPVVHTTPIIHSTPIIHTRPVRSVWGGGGSTTTTRRTTYTAPAPAPSWSAPAPTHTSTSFGTTTRRGGGSSSSSTTKQTGFGTTTRR